MYIEQKTKEKLCVEHHVLMIGTNEVNMHVSIKTVDLFTFKIIILYTLDTLINASPLKWETLWVGFLENHCK